MADPAALQRLAAACGISAGFHDIWGRYHPTDEASQRALLAALGEPVGDAAAAEQRLRERDQAGWRTPLASPLITPVDTEFSATLNLTGEADDRPLDWRLALEAGGERRGRVTLAAAEAECELDGRRYHRYTLTLPAVAEPGYHRLSFSRGGEPLAATTLVVAPRRCHPPPERCWGPALQLYTLRSVRNWGCGDFTDLKTVLEVVAEAGGDLVGVNPLHALFPHNPEHASPYSPSSRLFLNPLYVDVEAVLDFEHCRAAQEEVASDEFQARLRAVRASDLVDYSEVAELKLALLRRLYTHFRERHLELETGLSERGAAFRAYQTQGGKGEVLRRQALFEALQAHFFAADPNCWGWPAWPPPFRDPQTPEVQAFAAEQLVEVEFYEYLQWQAELQLNACAERAADLGMAVGVYRDLAVGVDSGGAETWADQALYALGARVGAPADEFSPKGQDWGLPPLIPERLRAAAYRPFIDTLRANMAGAGALRIDHVMGLMRQFWQPQGDTAAGAYVNYPWQDLLAILALESRRQRCLIVGEDLGTVPDEIRTALADLGVLSYRLLYFEKRWDHDGGFKPPQDYPEQALVSLSTHDLPTLAGYWAGVDLELRERLGLFPSAELRDQQTVARAEDRARLLLALEHAELLPAEQSAAAVPAEVSPELMLAIHRYLARTPARLLAFQLEDAFGQREQVNLPGTTDQYPNWRRKLRLNVEDWQADDTLQALFALLRAERGAAPEQSAAGVPSPRPLPAAGKVPRATYRVQLHRGFGFAQAEALVPYLAQLGVSHLYTSPFLQARTGSTHGYDIIGHDRLNPELGSEQDFERLTGALRRHGMGLVLDTVPNHMGVMGDDNQWWLDVLENGQAALHAAAFDIDWQPPKAALRDKVLLPLLGQPYGTVLERGELVLGYNPDWGEFEVRYFDHRLPLDPQSYAPLLRWGLSDLSARLGEQHPDLLEFASLADAFERLPEHRTPDPEQRAVRRRDQTIYKQRLRELTQRSADVAWLIEETVTMFNGTVGEPHSFDPMHDLLERQAYRLAYWRVAVDEINYRRFFDINELAGVRMEDPQVFAATHQLVLELLSAGKLDGLRIDHPDGLFDPAGYFARLQGEFGATPPGGTPPGQPLYLLAEKILEGEERLPEDWPIAGTSGYEFANLVNGLFIDPLGESALSDAYHRFIGREVDFDQLLIDCKTLICRSALASELTVLAGRLSRLAESDRASRDFTFNGLRDALVEVVARFPVYRSYITEAGVSDADRAHIDQAVAVAKQASVSADLSVYDFIHEVLLTSAAEGKPDDYRREVLAVAMKFQQYTGPVMAKGLEDTAFYRYQRLVSINEVGGDPRRFGCSVDEFHRANAERAERWPHAMLNTSTHDSKRSEDLRARLNTLSELADEWRAAVQRWAALNRVYKRAGDGRGGAQPNANDEYLFYQTLLGVWPMDAGPSAPVGELSERLSAYMLKAVREAKQVSSWLNPNRDYEIALQEFIECVLGSAEFLADFRPFARRAARLGVLNSLAQTLLKLTSPGVPDIYQGCELFDFSLVDPDNRRPVDFARRAELLERLQGFAPGTAPDRLKLGLTQRALALRARLPELFQNGGYLPLRAGGVRADNVCAFARFDAEQTVIVIAGRLFAGLVPAEAVDDPAGWPSVDWRDTVIDLTELANAPGQYRQVLYGGQLTLTGRRARLTALAGDRPVALLWRQNHAQTGE